MRRIWHRVELVVDRLLPLCLVILFLIIVIEFFFEELAHDWHFYIVMGDFFVVTIFAADLVFKYIRVKTVPLFIRRYWLDILAIFPFYLFLRAIEFALAAIPLSESMKSVQMILHEGLEVEREGARIVKEAGKTSRYHKLVRLIRPTLRLPRFLKLASFFETPTGNHHHHERT